MDGYSLFLINCSVCGGCRKVIIPLLFRLELAAYIRASTARRPDVVHIPRPDVCIYANYFTLAFVCFGAVVRSLSDDQH